MREYDELLAEAHAMGVHIRERELQPDVCGRYYEPMRLIVIDESMPDYEKYCTLVHELVHARYHDPGCGPQYAKAEARARRQTAILSVNAADYALAERMYGGDSYLIAQALNLTVQVIDDYKQLLHDSRE